MTMMANIEIIARIITTGTMLEDNSPDPKNPPDSVVESVDFGVSLTVPFRTNSCVFLKLSV